MPEGLVSIINLIQDGGFITLLIILAVPRLRKKIFNGEDKTINTKLDLIESNHLHAISETLKRIETIIREDHIRQDNKIENINEALIWLKAKSKNGH